MVFYTSIGERHRTRWVMADHLMTNWSCDVVMKLDSPGTAAIAQISLQWPYMQIITVISIKKLPKRIVKTESS